MKITVSRFLGVAKNLFDLNGSKSIVGLSRSILAFGLLLKLTFNDIVFLIPPYKFETLDLTGLKYRFNFFLLFGSSHLGLMKLLAIAILLIVISGYFIKATSLLHFWISFSLFLFSLHATGVEAVDMSLTLLLLPVCFFDERKNHWQVALVKDSLSNVIQNIFLVLIKLQVAFIYYDSFHDKIKHIAWRNGTVIYYWFTHNFFGLPTSMINTLNPLLTNMPFLYLITFSTLVFEILLALAFLFTRRYRLLFLRLGIFFHFLIWMIHGFAYLFFAMTAALLLYLYPSRKLLGNGVGKL